MGIQRQNQVDQFLNPSPSPSLVDDKQTLALTKIARLFCLKEHLFTPGPYTAILGATVSTDFDPSTRYSIPQDPVEAQDHLLTFFKSDIIATVPSLYQPPLLGKLGMQSVSCPILSSQEHSLILYSFAKPWGAGDRTSTRLYELQVHSSSKVLLPSALMMYFFLRKPRTTVAVTPDSKLCWDTMRTTMQSILLTAR